MTNPHLRLAGPSDLHAATVRQLLRAFTTHDRMTIERVIGNDCVWRVPGRSPVSGEYVGHQAVLDLFRYLRSVFDAPARFEIVDIATSGDRAICFQYGVALIDGLPVRLKECLVFRFEGRQIVEVDEFQFDQEGFDAIFSSRPRRVAEAR